MMWIAFALRGVVMKSFLALIALSLIVIAIRYASPVDALASATDGSAASAPNASFNDFNPILARLRAVQHAAAPEQEFKLAQQCEGPGPGEVYCGFADGYCLYCASDKPYFCANKSSCHASANDAAQTCGNDWTICGRPAN